MGDIIGYKGTAAERFASWWTMLELRRVIEWDKAQPNAPLFADTIKHDTDLYRKEFQQYLAA